MTGGQQDKKEAPPARSLVKTNTTSMVNYDLCCACGTSGDLICCESCPSSFHLDCVEPALEKVPAGSWYCNACYTSKHAPSHADAAADNEFFGPLIANLARKNPQVFHLPAGILKRKRKRGYAFGTKLTRILGAGGRAPLPPTVGGRGRGGPNVLDLPARSVAQAAAALEGVDIKTLERDALRGLSGAVGSSGGGGDGDDEPLNVNWCCKCTEPGGILLPCDLCARSYHPACIGVPDTAALDDSWICEHHNDLDVYAARVRDYVTKKQKTGTLLAPAGEHTFVDGAPVVLDFGLGPQGGLAPRPATGPTATATVTIPGIVPFATASTPSAAQQAQWVQAVSTLANAGSASATSSSASSSTGPAPMDTGAAAPLPAATPPSATHGLPTGALTSRIVAMVQQQHALHHAAMGQSSTGAPGRGDDAISPLALERVLTPQYTAFLAWQRLNQLSDDIRVAQAELLASGAPSAELELPLAAAVTGSASVAAAAASGTSAPDAGSPVLATLSNAAVTLPLTRGSVCVGRGAAADLDLAILNGATSVSRKHARIFRDVATHEFSILNYSAKNTFVNGAAIGDAPHKLKSGDTLRFGSLTLTFTVASTKLLL